MNFTPTCDLLFREKITSIQAGDILKDPQNTRQNLLNHIQIFIDHAQKNEDGDANEDVRVMNCIRLLASLDDDALVPYLFQILDVFADEWDLLVVDICHQALDWLAKPELFQVYWKKYAELKKEEDYLGVSNGFSDRGWSIDMLDHAIQCKASDRRIETELLNLFESESSRVAMMMSDAPAFKESFLPVLERHLQKIAPIQKYVPYNRLQIREHDEWIEVGSAWYELQNGVKKPNLEKRFFDDPISLSNSSRAEIARETNEIKCQLEKTFLKNLSETWIPSSHSFPSEIDLKLASYLSIPQRRGFKLGRNDPCICDSGKKYKKCCGK